MVGTGLWIAIIYSMRTVLKGLLSWHGWMFAPHGKITCQIRIWLVCICDNCFLEQFMLTNPFLLFYLFSDIADPSEDFFWHADTNAIQLPELSSSFTFAICEGHHEKSKLFIFTTAITSKLSQMLFLVRCFFQLSKCQIGKPGIAALHLVFQCEFWSLVFRVNLLR